MNFLTLLECGYCGKHHDAGDIQNLCRDCGKPLLARYDLEAAARTMTPDSLSRRAPDMWRYHEVLPVKDHAFRISLGEGWTPLTKAPALGRVLGIDSLMIKDESLNPTTSFKARGLSAAISKAYEFGVTAVSIPSAGNAAGAMSAYAAKAGIKAHVFMPEDVPPPFIAECKALGAEVHLVKGLITDCGKKAAEGVKANGWFDVSTLKEPYRIEGKKTMGYEIAEQLQWQLPDVIIYPTGGGTGLIGMWKAFGEMEAMGLVGAERPRMVSVQSTGCAPMVKAFAEDKEFADPWQNAATIADGLRVPAAVGDFLILRALRESNGTAIAVTDTEMMEYAMAMGRAEGIFPAPEGGAVAAAAMKLAASGWIRPGENVVLFNTGSGHKYYQAY